MIMCWKIRLRPAIKDSISFALSRNRVLLSFLLISLTMAALFLLFITIISSGFSSLTISAFFAVVLLVSVLSLMIKAAFVHNYTIRNSKENLAKSIDALNGKIKPLVYSFVLIFILSLAINSIPVIGGIGSILFSLAVIFVYQEIMLGKKGAIDSLKGSYRLFRENWRDVIAAILIIIIINALIVILALVPFAIPFAYTVADISVNTAASDFPELFAEAVVNNIWLYVVAGAIFVVGISIANLFSIGFTTDVYLQLKGMKNADKKSEKNKSKRKSRKKRKR